MNGRFSEHELDSAGVMLQHSVGTSQQAYCFGTSEMIEVGMGHPEVKAFVEARHGLARSSTEIPSPPWVSETTVTPWVSETGESETEKVFIKATGEATLANVDTVRGPKEWYLSSAKLVRYQSKRDEAPTTLAAVVSSLGLSSPVVSTIPC